MIVPLAAALLGGCALQPPSAGSALGSNARYEVGFSPGSCAECIVFDTINGAQHSLRVAAYMFTHRGLADALIAAHRRGVDVRVVADAREARQAESRLHALAGAGIPVRLNGRFAIHHHKFIVADDNTVETGSFNYTQAATRNNAENALRLVDVPTLAARYTAAWQASWDESQPYPSQAPQ
ncbi:hypothetical protein BJP62_09335 [Jeongeupia sp. USM3]|nr:hypothetical protein BJP62_09335 [Jeongeupia sp. USM3]